MSKNIKLSFPPSSFQHALVYAQSALQTLVDNSFREAFDIKVGEPDSMPHILIRNESRPRYVKYDPRIDESNGSLEITAVMKLAIPSKESSVHDQKVVINNETALLEKRLLIFCCFHDEAEISMLNNGSCMEILSAVKASFEGKGIKNVKLEIEPSQVLES